MNTVAHPARGGHRLVHRAWLAVDWGLIATTSLVTKRVSKPTSTLFHGVVASAGLALLVIHLGGLLVDRFMPFGPLDLLIPMRGVTGHSQCLSVCSRCTRWC